MGEHPEFSPEELAEIRRLAANEWSKVHHIKGETAVPSHRDRLTERLLTLERIEEKTR